MPSRRKHLLGIDATRVLKTGERSKPPSVRPGIRLSVRAARGEAAERSGYHGADLHR